MRSRRRVYHLDVRVVPTLRARVYSCVQFLELRVPETFESHDLCEPLPHELVRRYFVKSALGHELQPITFCTQLSGARVYFERVTTNGRQRSMAFKSLGSAPRE